jgi:hypothetical protein
MRNFWLNKVDKALRALGYIPEILDWFSEKEKEALIIDEYLYLLQEDREDCAPLSLDEMADYIVSRLC